MFPESWTLAQRNVYVFSVSLPTPVSKADSVWLPWNPGEIGTERNILPGSRCSLCQIRCAPSIWEKRFHIGLEESPIPGGPSPAGHGVSVKVYLLENSLHSAACRPVQAGQGRLEGVGGPRAGVEEPASQPSPVGAGASPGQHFQGCWPW